MVDKEPMRRQPCPPSLAGPHLLWAWVLPLLLALPACGGGGGGVPPGPTCVSGTGPPVTVSGTLLFERLTLTPGVGLTLPLITRPARFVDVEVRLAGGGTCYGTGSTDASGAYSLTAMPPAGSTLEVVVFSRTLEDSLRDIVVHRALPPGINSHPTSNAFSHGSIAFAGMGSPSISFTVPYNPGNPTTRPSIGFAILDTMVTCWEGLRTAPGVPPMPRVEAYCSLGNNFNLFQTSFYAFGTDALAILGGAAGNLDTSDTDYFDEAVLAHEFQHYVQDQLSYQISRGGSHQLAQPLWAGFAWSEGQCTGLGNLSIGTPDYLDSTGTAGGTLLDENVDAYGFLHPVGIGSETTTSEVLYDLGDGGSGNPADTDTDNMALSLGELYAVLFGFDAATDAPCLGLFLERLVALNGGVSQMDVNTLLAGTVGDAHAQALTLPLAGGDVWPLPLPLMTAPVGTVDSTFGGVNKNQCNGDTSVIWYRLSLPTAQSITLGLTMVAQGGTVGNLDLFLAANASPFTPLFSSTNAGTSAEQIGPVVVPAGEYLVRVEAATCVGVGQAATFTLTAN